MAVPLTDAQRKVLQAPNYAHLATLMADGSPQVSPVWIDVDGDQILINTAAGRVKERNIRRDPRVAISIRDLARGEEHVTIRGRVVEITEEGAVDHINALARKYSGKDYQGMKPGMVRLIVRIEADHVTGD